MADAIEPAPSPAEATTSTAPNGDEAALQVRGDRVRADLAPVSRPDDQLYILELRLRQLVLSDGIFGYVDRSVLLLPLGQLADALEFPISVDPAEGRAEGWFLSENRIFSLDVARREVVVEGRRGTFDARSVELHADDIYVDTRLLSNWFPVALDFDLSNSLVKVRSREPLPIESRLAREELRARLRGLEADGASPYETLETPYKMADWPFFDFSTETGYRKDANGDPEAVVRYNGLITADLLRMSARAFVAGDETDGLSQARLTLGRKDPEGELAGPLHLTEFSIGDIVTPTTTLISDPNFGRGAEVSTFPIGQTGQFNRADLIGDLPLGWDVELYRNEVLIDFQLSRPDGRYEFLNVPLVFGTNVLRLEFYGPQGQRRTEVRRILVGEEQTPKGRLNLRLAANQQDTDLFDVDDGPVTGPEAALAGEGRVFLEGAYGLTRNFSLGAGVSSIPLISGRRTYGSLGGGLRYRNTFSELDLVADDQGGVAGQLGLQMILPADLSLLIEHGEFRDFISEDADDNAGLLERRSNLRLDGVIYAGMFPRIPFTLSGTYELRDTGYEEIELANRLSMVIRMLSFTNSIAWTRIDDTFTTNRTANGSLLIGGRFGRANVRGEVRYDLEPDPQFSAAGITGDWYFDTDFNARLSFQREYVVEPRSIYGVGVSRKFKFASVGLTGEYDTNDASQVLLSVSFGIGRDPRTGKWHARADSVAEDGAISARAFLDNNTNGVYDEGDEPLSGIRFNTSRGRPRETTDDDGVVFLTGLTSYEARDVSLPARSLSDPYWVAQPEGVSMVPRPGSAAVADFPVVTTGEIDGTAYLMRDGVRREVSEVKVQLVDVNGIVVKETRTAYDGFYLFDSLLPGRYTVRVDPAQLERLDLAGSAPKPLVIRGDGTIISGADIALFELSP
ncbi:MAG: hypothetical protein JSU82_12155 [Rhodospirillales bacterium]|nr:MAG: hypothetical protein JSU82_12155 [Rhodospirillales bacterium]